MTQLTVHPETGEMVFADRSADLDKLFGALAKAQGAMRAAGKDRSVGYDTRQEGRVKYNYATLAAVLEVCRGPLADNGLAVVQQVSQAGAGVTVVSILGHESGQWISSALTLNSAQTTAQAIGSAITYARRYTYMALVGAVSEDEDDDGQGASQRPAPDRIEEPEQAPRPRVPVERVQERTNPAPAAAQSGAPATAGHWMADAGKRTTFWAETRRLGMTPAGVHTLFGVDSLMTWKGTFDEAMAALSRAHDAATAGPVEAEPASE